MAEYDKVIPPGQTGKIRAKIDTKKESGKLEKTIVVVSNDPGNEKTVLHLFGSVLGVKILPQNRAYYSTYAGKSQTKELTVATLGDGPITVNAVASKPNIVVRMEPTNEPKPEGDNEYWNQYKLFITIPENFPEGRFSESVTLATNSEYTPLVKIDIAGSVTPALTVSPTVVRLNYTGDGKPPQRIIRITRNIGQNFKVTRVITDPPQLTAKLEEKRKGEQFLVNLTWTDLQTKGEFNGKVTIHTNDSRKPVIQVPVHVTIK